MQDNESTMDLLNEVEAPIRPPTPALPESFPLHCPEESLSQTFHESPTCHALPRLRLPAKRPLPSTVQDDDDEDDIPDTPDLQSTFGARALGHNKARFSSVFMTCFGTAHELSRLPNTMREWDIVKCFVLANETATTTGRPHVHILCKFHNRPSGTAIWKQLGMNCDLRPVKHWGKAVNYLKKQDPSPVCYNMESAPKPGKRNDIQAIKDAIVSGKSAAEVASLNLEFALRNPQGLKYMHTLFAPTRDPNVKPEVRCYIGMAGSGKSRDARTELGTYFQKPPSTKWWDGYAGESNVLVDEITGGCAPYSELLTYLDYGKPSIELKGGSYPLLATKFIFTSNHSVSSWYSSDKVTQHLDALYRRIDVVRIYYAPYDPALGARYEELRNPSPSDGSIMRRMVEEAWERHFPGFIDAQSSPSP